MSLHIDENAVRDRHAEIAGKSAKRKSRKIWALAGFGTVMAGTAAFAAVQLFGFGSIDAEAATLKNLNVSGVKLSSTLAPGTTANTLGYVGNGNDFDVTVTAVIVQDSSVEGKGADCDPKTLTVGGVPVKVYPGAGGGTGHQFNLASPVTIGAGKTVEVKVPGVVSQDSKATALCGVKANFAVVAAVGN